MPMHNIMCILMCGRDGPVKCVRVNITLEPEDIQRLQELERETGKSRSELIREAIRAYRPSRRETVNREEALRLLETVRIELPEDAVTMIRRMREGAREW